MNDLLIMKHALDVLMFLDMDTLNYLRKENDEKIYFQGMRNTQKDNERIMGFVDSNQVIFKKYCRVKNKTDKFQVCIADFNSGDLITINFNTSLEQSEAYKRLHKKDKFEQELNCILQENSDFEFSDIDGPVPRRINTIK